MPISTTFTIGGEAHLPQDATKILGRLACSTTQANIAVNPQKELTVVHEGVDITGAAASQAIWMSVAAPGATDLTVDATGTGGLNTYLLQPGQSFVLPPGVGYVGFKTASGTPAVGLLCGAHLLGSW